MISQRQRQTRGGDGTTCDRQPADQPEAEAELGDPGDQDEPRHDGGGEADLGLGSGRATMSQLASPASAPRAVPPLRNGCRITPTGGM